MTVDFNRPTKILVIHGVQRGTNDDQTQDTFIDDSIRAQLTDLRIPFDVDIFKYEDINDDAYNVVKRALAALTNNLIAGWVVQGAVDAVGDVALALSEGDTYRQIKSKLHSRIIDSFNVGDPLFIVAHSLGSVYAFDVVNDIMRRAGYFIPNQVETRPVQGLFTIGSPLALDLFERDWQDAANLVPTDESIDDNFRLFPWRNYWDPTDPIVSGNIIGLPWNERQFEEKFGDRLFDLGWDVRSRRVLTGESHVKAHTAYWRDLNVGVGIRQLIVRHGRENVDAYTMP